MKDQSKFLGVYVALLFGILSGLAFRSLYDSTAPLPADTYRAQVVTTQVIQFPDYIVLITNTPSSTEIPMIATVNPTLLALRPVKTVTEGGLDWCGEVATPGVVCKRPYPTPMPPTPYPICGSPVGKPGDLCRQ